MSRPSTQVCAHVSSLAQQLLRGIFFTRWGCQRKREPFLSLSLQAENGHMTASDVLETQRCATTSPVRIKPAEVLVMALLTVLQSLHCAAEPPTLPSLSAVPFTNLSVPPPYSRGSTTGTVRAENIFLSRNNLQLCRVSSQVSWLRFESSMGCCIH